MPVRIVVVGSDGSVTLRLLGPRGDDGAARLQKAYETCARDFGLDFTELQSSDDAGAAYLRGVLDAGVQVSASDPYVKALLRQRDPGQRARRGAKPSRGAVLRRNS